MKRPRPRFPENAPPDTTWFGGPISWFSIAIEIMADDLNPDEVTSLLGIAPTQKQREIGKVGRWSLQLKPGETDEWDVAEAVKLLIARVPADRALWKSISSRAKVRVSVGLSLKTRNQGLSIDPALLHLLADREMQLDFDVYTDKF